MFCLLVLCQWVGSIALYATLASRDVVRFWRKYHFCSLCLCASRGQVIWEFVLIQFDFPKLLKWVGRGGCGWGWKCQDCCMIPEAPFYLEGAGGLFEFVYRRLRENGHVVLVVAEGAGQDLVAQTLQSNELIDASGNQLLRDIGHWLSQQMKVINFSNSPLQVWTLNK